MLKATCYKDRYTWITSISKAKEIAKQVEQEGKTQVDSINEMEAVEKNTGNRITASST